MECLPKFRFGDNPAILSVASSKLIFRITGLLWHSVRSFVNWSQYIVASIIIILNLLFDSAQLIDSAQHSLVLPDDKMQYSSNKVIVFYVFCAPRSDSYRVVSSFPSQIDAASSKTKTGSKTLKNMDFPI